MTRKEFLKATGIMLAVAPLASALHSCAPSAPVVKTVATGSKVRIPAGSVPDLSVPFSFVKVYVGNEPHPYVLFRGNDGKFRAVLATCTHNGCEVKKTRTAFECPCHGSEYDLTGRVVGGPAPDPLEVYDVQVAGDHYEFDIL